MTETTRIFIIRIVFDFTVILLWMLVRFRFMHHFWVYVTLTLPGTLAHELMHWLAAIVTNGKPSTLSIIPQRRGSRWHLGHVSLKNPRWYNTGIIALAPLGLPLLAYLFYRQVVLHQPLTTITHWLFLYLVFEVIASSLPSREDIALIYKTHGHWFLLSIICAGVYWRFLYF